VVALRPDVIVDVGSADPTYASLADRVQAQTGIPYVLIDGSFERTPATLRELGTVLGVAARGEELAGYAEQVLGDVRARLAGLPEEVRPRVYYGRGPEGLDTGFKGSINVEILDLVGARNVAEGAGAGSLATISAEQVLAWDPDASMPPSARAPCGARSKPCARVGSTSPLPCPSAGSTSRLGSTG
jgi:iron complex transport system substrate-binding protein